MREEISGDWTTVRDSVVAIFDALPVGDPDEVLTDLVCPWAGIAVRAISPAIPIVCSVRTTNLMGDILTSLVSAPRTETASSVASVSEVLQSGLSLKLE